MNEAIWVLVGFVVGSFCTWRVASAIFKQTMMDMVDGIMIGAENELRKRYPNS